MRKETYATHAAAAASALLFLYLAASGGIQLRILGVVVLSLALWSLYPGRHLESSLLVIALISFFEASVDVGGFLSSLLGTYGGSGLWIIVSGFVLAKGMEASGLGRRVALGVATGMGCRPRNILVAVAAANLVLAPLSPSTTAKAFLLLPILVGLAESFGLEKGRSRFGAALFLVAMASNNVASTGFLTATVPNPITAGHLAEIGVSLDWLGWLRMGLPLSLALTLVALVLALRIFEPEAEASQESFRRVCDLRDSLGPLRRGEKVTAVVFSACFLLWTLDRSLPFNAGILSLALSLLLLAPGAGVLEARGFSREVPYGSILLFAASMFLARAVGAYDALDPVAGGVFNLLNLDALGPTVFTWALVVGAMLLHVAFTSTTAYATVMIPLVVGLNRLHGLDPAFSALAVGFLTPVAVILPVNTIPNIVFFEEGWFTERQMLLYGAILSLISVLLVLAVGQPYWRMLGLVG